MTSKSSQRLDSVDTVAGRIRRGALLPSGLLLEAHTALASAIDCHAVAALGLAPDVVDLLVRLELAPDNYLRGIDISRQLLIHPSRTSRLIDRAEAAGVVTRQPDPEDRRAQRITFTEGGKQAVGRFMPRLLTVLDQTIFASLTPAEIKTLIALLTRVRDTARSVAECENELCDEVSERGASSD